MPLAYTNTDDDNAGFDDNDTTAQLHILNRSLGQISQKVTALHLLLDTDFNR